MLELLMLQERPLRPVSFIAILDGADEVTLYVSCVATCALALLLQFLDELFAVLVGAFVLCGLVG
jgi:cadmium resistance protein CadD (predicted permease)